MSDCLFEMVQRREILDGADGVLLEVLVDQIQVCPEILYFATPKLDIVVAEPITDQLLMSSGKVQHGQVEVNADDPASGANDLGHELTALAAA